MFVDGCFWHACPEHGTVPKANRAWWQAKLARNRERDVDTDRRLKESGWTSVRVWEHEPAEHGADRVIELLHRRRAELGIEGDLTGTVRYDVGPAT